MVWKGKTCMAERAELQDSCQRMMNEGNILRFGGDWRRMDSSRGAMIRRLFEVVCVTL